MQTSVKDVLQRRRRSRFFTGRNCCLSEKRAKVITMLGLAGALGLYTYLQIVTMIDAYANPVREVKLPALDKLVLPGFYLCMPFTNLSSNYVDNPQPRTFYMDPRQSSAPFIHTNNPMYPNTPFLIDCCLTPQFDFFTSCFTNAQTCPVPVKFRQNIKSTYGQWSISFQCFDIAPGITFRQSSENLFIPFYNSWDNGVLAQNQDLTPANNTNSFVDFKYRQFCDNYVFWPSKYVLLSYEPRENATSPLDIYFGLDGVDDAIGGSQNRIKTDVGRGIASLLITRFRYWDVNGVEVAANTGWTVSYDLTLASLPWTNANSPWLSYRTRANELGWLRIHVSMQETQTRERVAFTYLNLITTFLSVIGAATAMTHFIVGPGDYDPTGLLNKLFYFDVPVLKEAATDLSADVVEKNKGGDDDDDDDDEDDDD